MLDKGSLVQKAIECVRRAEQAEAQALAVKAALLEYLKKKGREKYLTFELGRLPAWKVAIADNQWYISQATMYGTMALLEELRAAIRTLGVRQYQGG